METGHRARRAETTSSSTSVLQGDETFYNRVISRDSTSSSSIRCPSSRVFYYRSAAEGVPFKWETQPGTPKNPPKEDTIPPISPPPAVLSLAFPKPPINDDVKSHDGDGGGGGRYYNARKLKLLWKFLVGKGSARRRRRYAGHHQPQGGRLANVNSNDKNTRRRSWDEGGDNFNIASPRNSSFSSSGMSRSSSTDDGYSRLSTNSSDASSGSGRSRRRETDNNNEYGRGCGSGRPWNINSMLVCVSGKI